MKLGTKNIQRVAMKWARADELYGSRLAVELARALTWEEARAVAKRTMRSVIFAALSRLPIRMNNGAATMGNAFIACAIFCGTMEGDRPERVTKPSAANAMAA